MSKEAMKLALEALEEIALAGMSVPPEMIDSREAFHARQAWCFISIAAKAMVPVKKALAEQPAPMSEPNRVIAYSAAIKLRELGYEWMNDEWKHLDELAEQPAQQEPVAWMWKDGTITSDPDRADGTWMPLYTTPPAQRKPLTDKQFQAIKDSLFRQEGLDGEGWDLALKENIEAAHGIKEQP